jgi:hypothetical protein
VLVFTLKGGERFAEWIRCTLTVWRACVDTERRCEGSEKERERESEKKKEREEEVRIGRDGVRCEGSSEYTAGMHTNTQTHLGKKPTSQRHRP